MNSKQVGIITEQTVITKLLELGYTVSTVIGDNSPYDLVMEKDGILLRVQVKTGRLRNGSIIFSAVSCRINTKRLYITDYYGKADVFIVYCRDNNEFLRVPVLGSPRSSMVIRISRTKKQPARRC